jgi:hypothetical protein
VKPSETLRTLSRMMAALREHAPTGEITYQCGDWKMCDRINGNGTVTNFYTYPGEPESVYPLKVTLFTCGRSYTVTIQSEKELANA